MAKIPKNVHFIGIGGAGMSGLAALLLSRGHRVTGSDTKSSAVTERLEVEGVAFSLGHAAEHLGSAELVVISSAIKPDNVEVVEARKRGIPVIRRGELLAEVMRGYRGVAVAGAHGKTTTTAMIASVLIAGGLDPTVLVGGEWSAIGGNFRLGRSRYFVTEADESDASFLLLSPEVAVVTNIENDHLDYYGGMDALVSAFRDFVEKVPRSGLAVVCVDDPRLKAIMADAGVPVVTYGEKPEADYRVEDVSLAGVISSGDLYFLGKLLGRLTLNVPGKHNLLNAACAITVGLHFGVSFKDAAEALASYRAVKRRFEVLGELNGICVVDDYAHHPTEVAATIRAARQLNPGRVIAVFQPHRFTRTALLYEEFGQVFGGADLVFVDEIYSAGEAPLPGVTAELIRKAIARNGREVVRLPSDSAAAYLKHIVRPGDLVLTLGAGDIYKVGLELVKLLGNVSNDVSNS
ncbi:MAG: UDP-N-acetylmuramate--L-alanine ligase [Firmicutes bacterium]|nr:UDP-N-acetylmuramate--L-alanine ligase [Bacillota bacterium]